MRADTYWLRIFVGEEAALPGQNIDAIDNQSFEFCLPTCAVRLEPPPASAESSLPC